MTDLVQHAKGLADSARDALLKTLMSVPDEKLTWSPSATARSALGIAAHAGVSNRAFAGIIRGKGMPDLPMDELVQQMVAAEAAITSREQAVGLIQQTTAAVHAALDALTPELVSSLVETPMMTQPMTLFMVLPGIHMYAHAAQIDYVETVWGDMESHI